MLNKTAISLNLLNKKNYYNSNQSWKRDRVMDTSQGATATIIVYEHDD